MLITVTDNSTNYGWQLPQDEKQQSLRRWDSCRWEGQTAPHLTLVGQNAGPWPQSSSCNTDSQLHLSLQQPFLQAHSIRSMKTSL